MSAEVEMSVSPPPREDAAPLDLEEGGGEIGGGVRDLQSSSPKNTPSFFPLSMNNAIAPSDFIPSEPTSPEPSAPAAPKPVPWPLRVWRLMVRIEESNAPKLSCMQLFLKFMGFGIRAFGGPAAQIAAFKQILVIEEKWITVQQFNRVLAVYQTLPGPEATELCTYFGLLSNGRKGALAAGIGFLLPGVCLVLLCSFLYDKYGMSSPAVNASFHALQPMISSMILRASHRIGEHALIDHETLKFNAKLMVVACVAALFTVLHINVFIILGFCGFLGWLSEKEKVLRPKLFVFLFVLLNLLAIALYIVLYIFVGAPSDDSIGSKMQGNRSLGGLFSLGLLGGLLTFGGAYTAIPFIRSGVSPWMASNVFLDVLSYASLVPSPLVVFVCGIGYLGGGVGGALLMTLGMFLPAFSFTLLGHSLFEFLVSLSFLQSFLDGITACVVGMISITSFQLIRSAVKDHLQVIVFFLGLGIQYKFAHRWLSVFLMFFAAVVGQVLFLQDSSD